MTPSSSKYILHWHEFRYIQQEAIQSIWNSNLCRGRLFVADPNKTGLARALFFFYWTWVISSCAFNNALAVSQNFSFGLSLVVYSPQSNRPCHCPEQGPALQSLGNKIRQNSPGKLRVSREFKVLHCEVVGLFLQSCKSVMVPNSGCNIPVNPWPCKAESCQPMRSTNIGNLCQASKPENLLHETPAEVSSFQSGPSVKFQSKGRAFFNAVTSRHFPLKGSQRAEKVQCCNAK